MSTTPVITAEIERDVKEQILRNFPGRSNITLGEIGHVLRGSGWKLVVRGMAFTESGSGRDITAEFQKDDTVWIISDWYYDY